MRGSLEGVTPPLKGAALHVGIGFLMRVAVILNPVSGRNLGHRDRLRRQVEAITESARRRAVELAVHLTSGPGHATTLATSAVRGRADVVAAWGGDGTVNEVAAALEGTESALAVLPAGSGSGLARALGVPLDVTGAFDVAIGRATRRIDTGRIGDRAFVNVAGLGFDAHIARVFNTERLLRPRRRGLASYVRLTLREFFAYRPQPCRVIVGGERIVVRALLVAFANSPQYGNGACIAPAARLDDGEVDVVVVQATSPVRDLLRARRLFSGSIAHDAAATLRRSRRVRVEADGPVLFHTDGEAHEGGDRLDVEMQAGALRVCVPCRDARKEA